MTLEGWTESSFTHDGSTYPTYRRGSGPGVIVVHEVPGITPKVEAFANEVVDAGFTVVLPSLFGTPGVPQGLGAITKVITRVCISSEFVTMGETREEISATLRELHEAGCELLTITQYLRPSVRHHPIERWVTPEEFVELEAEALSVGFAGVLSGPLVRSSYRAGRLYRQALVARS